MCFKNLVVRKRAKAQKRNRWFTPFDIVLCANL